MNDFIALAVALLAAGAASGLLAGLFGVGGGAVLVPTMDQALEFLGYSDEVRLHMALGTSLGVIIPTAIRSFASHRARGAVDMALLKSWAIPMPLGAFLAAGAAATMSGESLRIVFAVIAFLVALRFLFQLDRYRLGTEVPGGPVQAAVGAFIGFIATLMGVGGGVMSGIYMMLYGRPIHQAVATSAGAGILIAIPGAIGYMAAGFWAQGLPPLSIGYVSLPGVLLMMPLTLVFAPLGVRLAHGASKRQLELGFGIFLAAISIKFAYDVLA